MVKEDQYIEDRFGKARPFKAPDGYFDGLAEQLMARLPEREINTVPLRPSVWHRMRPVAIAAAGVVAAVLSATVYFNRPEAHPDGQPSVAEMQQESTLGDVSVDYAAYYAMLDNVDFYAMMADE